MIFRVLLNRKPTSNQLISTSINVFATPSTLLEQNITCNWAISQNLGGKIQNCLFCLKIATHSISRMIMLIPTLVFWIFNPKSIFWVNLGQKSQSCLFCLKMDTLSMVRTLKLIPTLIFPMSNHIPIFRQIWAEKVKIILFMILFPLNRSHYWSLGTLYLVLYLYFVSL